MRINNNLMAMNTHRQLGIANNAGAKSMEKLSSGFRINRAGDDAAGLSISEKMRGQIRGLNQASSNSQDGISLIQTAEGALDETHAILKRMRELAVQAGNEGTLQSDDLEAIKDEFTELAEEINGIADRTEFNGKKLLDGSYEGVLQIGANQEQQLDLGIALLDENGTKINNHKGDTEGKLAGKIDSTNLGVNVVKIGDIIDGETIKDGATGILLDLDDIEVENKPAEQAKLLKSVIDHNLEQIDGATKAVSKVRSHLGANQNRLEHTIKNLDNAAENLQAAESRIRDVDMAKEMMEQTKQNILQQASTAMLAQANMAPQTVLQLLG